MLEYTFIVKLTNPDPTLKKKKKKNLTYSMSQRLPCSLQFNPHFLITISVSPSVAVTRTLFFFSSQGRQPQPTLFQRCCCSSINDAMIGACWVHSISAISPTDRPTPTPPRPHPHPIPAPLCLCVCVSVCRKKGFFHFQKVGIMVMKCVMEMSFITLATVL